MFGFWIDQVVVVLASTIGCLIPAVLQFGFGIG